MVEKATKPLVLLGDLQFELAESPRSFQFAEKSTYAEIGKIEAKSTLQFVGDALKTLSLDFRLHPAWCNPEEQIRALQKAKASRKPMPLTIGDGTFNGNFVIEDLSFGLSRTDLEGRIIECTVSVKLKETIAQSSPPKSIKSPFKKRTR